MDQLPLVPRVTKNEPAVKIEPQHINVQFKVRIHKLVKFSKNIYCCIYVYKKVGKLNQYLISSRGNHKNWNISFSSSMKYHFISFNNTLNTKLPIF